MPDDDQIQEIAGPLVEVAETNRLYRLSPATDDLAQTSRRIAIVAAETEDEARSFVTKADPLGRDWNNRNLFVADQEETPERHVLGDLLFKSVPKPGIPRAKRPKTP
jgi:hypothetical protein